MKKILIMIILLAVMLFSKEVKVVFSYSTAPYVFKDGSGIVLTIVKEALAYKGHSIEPIFVNMGRAFELFRDGHVDVNLITQTTPYKTAFKDEKLRDDFNEGMKYLKKTGRYDEIYDEYSKKYFKVEK